MLTPCCIGVYGSHKRFERTGDRRPWTVANHTEELEWGLATAKDTGSKRFAGI